MTGADGLVAAGAVVLDRDGRVLLVHRPRYDDWSLPKGKLDSGEHVTAAAVREVREETGVRIRLGPPLTPQAYPVARGTKTVHYWAGHSLDADADKAPQRWTPNAEIDALAWCPADEARVRLSYAHDAATLREARRLPRATSAVVVLRHGKALPRAAWSSDDRRRPLADRGLAQAERVVPVLAAYGVQAVVTSTSTRCRQTVEPYAAASGLALDRRAELSEEDATPGAVRRLIAGLRDARTPAVVCTHRPVLPAVFAALGLDDPHVDTGELVVVHLRKGDVVATERHRP